MKEVYVMDACALIAYFNNENGADRVACLLKRALKKEVEIFTSAVNLCEVYYEELTNKRERKGKGAFRKD